MDSRELSRDRVSTGISYVDRMIGHLALGDNVIWYDPSGRLAWPFAYEFVQSSNSLDKPVLYVTFDHSPGDLLEQLGDLADNPHLGVLDCFSAGLGRESRETRSSENRAVRRPCRIIQVEDPERPKAVSDALWDVLGPMNEDVRLVFESLTGMQELWKWEKTVYEFYSQTCPKLYEQGHVAYWMAKRDILSSNLWTQLNEIAQIVMDLSVARGKSFLIPRKTGKTGAEHSTQKHKFWIDEDQRAKFTGKRGQVSQLDLSARIKQARKMRGMSQAELAKQIGVCASTLSQTESNLILPSLPTLLKMAEVLSLDPSFFLSKKEDSANKLVYSIEDAKEIVLPLIGAGSAVVKGFIEPGSAYRTSVYSLEIPPHARLERHFVNHKGEELGLLLTGELDFSVEGTVHRVSQGGLIYLPADTPDEWRNPGRVAAKLVWVTIGRPKGLSEH